MTKYFDQGKLTLDFAQIWQNILTLHKFTVHHAHADTHPKLLINLFVLFTSHFATDLVQDQW